MLKVFLVEDESLIREGIRDKIPWNQYGYRFTGDASDGEMALPMIRKLHPDVLITDIEMPFMDGLSLSKIVKEEFPRTKVIIISGYDNFEYAKEAIEAGVDQYLLKPITRMNLRKVLIKLKEKIDREREVEDCQMQMQRDMLEYEQFTRRRFFENALEGEWSVKELLDEAASCSIELLAPAYNLLFLYLQDRKQNASGRRRETFVQMQEEILHYFLCHPQYILFRWNVNTYGILIKADMDQMPVLTDRAQEHVRRICEPAESEVQWYMAIGNSVERLSSLPACYQEVNHYFAYRFICPWLHLYTKDTLADQLNVREEKKLMMIDAAKVNPHIIREFLAEGNECEIDDFANSYLQSIDEALKSHMFLDYVVLNIRFTIIEYMETLGVSKETYLQRMKKYADCVQIDVTGVREYLVDSLQAAIVIRDEESNSQGGRTIQKILDYIEEHFTEDTLSLSSVASEVDVSTNYLSSIFSQTMKKTFTEYVFEKRMKEARKLLKTTDMPTSKIAQAVGYKDAHYFSYVFRKGNGVSPRDYRANALLTRNRKPI